LPSITLIKDAIVIAVSLTIAAVTHFYAI
jgi:hypothetical protein